MHWTVFKNIFFTYLGHSPHFAVLVISAVSGLSGITLEHHGLATVIDIPIVAVINKIDLASSSCLEKTFHQLENLFQTPGYAKVYMSSKYLNVQYFIVHVFNLTVCSQFLIKVIMGTMVMVDWK